jgi:hypothetical protein
MQKAGDEFSPNFKGYSHKFLLALNGNVRQQSTMPLVDLCAIRLEIMRATIFNQSSTPEVFQDLITSGMIINERPAAEFSRGTQCSLGVQEVIA